jgi:DNA-binding transcriptional LysR family regulator
MRKLVEVGVGISFLPYLTVQESLDSGVLKDISVKGISFSREIGVAWRTGRYFGPAIRHLLDAIFERFGRDEEWQTLVN